MKFRSYQLFYLLATVLVIAALCMPLVQFVESNGATSILNNFKLVLADGTTSSSPIALGVVLIVTAVVNLFGMLISGFQNFELQKRVSILAMLLIVGYYLLLGIYTWVLATTALSVQLALLFPLIALVLNALSFFATRRTEAAILAKASGFRLRD
ncbi:MAG: DUF4293 family protein [Bacteroidaceae bacterium]|nr:DUF4293 family protein [Bacteroidaceae bacterium]